MFSQANQINILEIQLNINGALVALFEPNVWNVQWVQRYKVNAIKTWVEGHFYFKYFNKYIIKFGYIALSILNNIDPYTIVVVSFGIPLENFWITPLATALMQSVSPTGHLSMPLAENIKKKNVSTK